MSDAPVPTVQSEVLAQRQDPDFGVIQLVRSHVRATTEDGEETTILVHEWKSLAGDGAANLTLLVDGPDDEMLSPDHRERLKFYLTHAEGIRSAAAQLLLPVAESWASSQNLPSPTPKVLFDGFRLSEITVSGGEVSVWMRDTSQIFGGRGFLLFFDADNNLIDAVMHE